MSQIGSLIGFVGYHGLMNQTFTKGLIEDFGR
jgi:hypothetical protein